MNPHKTRTPYMCQTLLASASLHRKWEDALGVCCDPILPPSTAGFKPLLLHPITTVVCGTGHQQELFQPSVTKQPAHRKRIQCSATCPHQSKVTSQPTTQSQVSLSRVHNTFPQHSQVRSPLGSHFAISLKSSRRNLPKESSYRRHRSPLNQDLLCCNIIDVN